MSNGSQIAQQLVMQEFLETVTLTGVTLHFINLLRQHRETNDLKKTALEKLTDKLEYIMTHPTLEHTDDIRSDFNNALTAYGATMDDNTEAYMLQLFNLCQVVAIRCSDSRPYTDVLESELSRLNLWSGEPLFAPDTDKSLLPPEVIESELRLRPLLQKLRNLAALARIGNMSFERNSLPSNEVENLIDRIVEEFEICGAYLSSQYAISAVISDLEMIVTKSSDVQIRAEHLAEAAQGTVGAAQDLIRRIREEADSHVVNMEMELIETEEQ